MTFDFRIRPREPQDVGFIAGYWLESLAREGLAHRLTPISRVKRAIGDRLRADARTLPCVVAHDPDDHDHLWGFAIGDAGCMHWVYVTRHRRGAGLARAMVDAWRAAHGPIACHRYACTWTARHSRVLVLSGEAL